AGPRRRRQRPRRGGQHTGRAHGALRDRRRPGARAAGVQQGRPRAGGRRAAARGARGVGGAPRRPRPGRRPPAGDERRPRPGDDDGARPRHPVRPGRPARRRPPGGRGAARGARRGRHAPPGSVRRRHGRPLPRVRGVDVTATDPRAAPGFRPPPYPYDRLDDLRRVAAALPGGAVELSIGTPCDPPPPAVVRALGISGAERGCPPWVGTAALREAAARWLARRFGAEVDPAHVAACVGTKELVAGVPHWLRLRTPDRDTVLYPATSYPSYAMGATLAGCRAVAYRSLAEIDPADAARALCLWVNSPANPTGELADLAAVAAWGRDHGVPVLS